MPFIQPPLPGPINIDIAPGDTGSDFDYAVYAKEMWGHATWTAIPHLIPLTAVDADLNGQSIADFIYDYGRVKQNADSGFKGYESIFFSKTAGGVVRPLRDLFVAIKVIPKDGTSSYCLWAGYLPSERIEAGAKRDTTATGLPHANYPLQQGMQTLRAYGFQYLLERRRIRGSIVRAGADVSSITPTRNPNTQPPFNERGASGRHQLGNRSLNRIRQDVFSVNKGVSFGFGNDGQKWSTLQVIEYLLFWSNDVSTSLARPFFALDGTADPEDATLTPGDSSFNELHYLLNRHDLIEVAQEGHDVLSLLRRLIDPRRGFGAHLRWSDVDGDQLPKADSDIVLSLFSYADKATTIGGVTHPANPLIFEDDIDSSTNLAIRSVNIEVDSSNVYDEVIIQGEPMVVCFSASMGFASGSGPYALLDKAWEPADETAYLAAADAARNHDTFERVYTTFKLIGAGIGATEFDWKAQNLNSLLPTFDDLAMIQASSGPGGFFNFGKGLLRELPLRTPLEEIGEVADSGYVRSFAAVERLSATGMSTAKWELAHKPSVPGQAGIVAAIDISANVVPADRNLEIAIKFGHNHALAKNHFAPSGGQPPSLLQPRFDYEKMIVTVAVESDVRPAVILRPTASHSTTKVRRLVINVDDCQTWWVAPGTVWGLNADSSLRAYPFPGLVRDDTQRLRDIAAMCSRQYGQPNISVSITRHGLYDIYAVGWLLKAKTKSTLVHLQRDPNDNSDTKEILSVITQRAWDFRTKTITVTTGPIHYGSLD